MPVKKEDAKKSQPKGKEKKAPARRFYKLLAGQHIGPDLSQEPDEETGRYPSKTWNAGQVVESETDLCHKHGDQKFAEVGQPRKLQTPGDVTDEAEESGVATFPAGQRSTGYQDSSVAKQGSTGEEYHVPQNQEEAEEEVSAPTEGGEGEGGEESAEEGEEADFRSMTITELKKEAEDRDVDLAGCKNRAEMIDKLQGNKGKGKKK
jgi:hypothetical protein